MWLSLNKGSYTESKRKMLVTAVNVAMITLAVVLVSLKIRSCLALVFTWSGFC